MSCILYIQFDPNINFKRVRKSSEARNSSYMEELRSRKNSEYLNRYKIVRVERAVSREEESILNILLIKHID